jgi:hypothetical protein
MLADSLLALVLSTIYEYYYDLSFRTLLWDVLAFLDCVCRKQKISQNFFKIQHEIFRRRGNRHIYVNSQKICIYNFCITCLVYCK